MVQRAWISGGTTELKEATLRLFRVLESKMTSVSSSEAVRTIMPSGVPMSLVDLIAGDRSPRSCLLVASSVGSE
ncbi:hypothetical protein E2C01_040549 [Portunus trituberculatus]|uniref:Uncharacterized protein n=1 Tax=Portunus trituberculatus TaxID=210409 RepID=A0A5B7FNJ2_PORTR|nr:hypothetical protein [Portunus trituberculatus]